MTKPAAAAPAEETTERFVAAAESRFAKSAEFTFPLTSYVPVADTPLEHVLRPEYWANVKALVPGCRIWVMPEDERWWAELLVRQVGPGFAKVTNLRHGELDPIVADPQVAKEFDIQFRGAVVKWRVVRLKDQKVLKDKIASQDEALSWVRDHKRAMAA